jgi:hypothetical protein
VRSNLAVRGKTRQKAVLRDDNLVDVSQSQTDDDYEAFFKRENILTPSEAKKIQSSIKLKFSKNSIIHFLFSDLKKIRKFFKRSKIIKSSYIPPRIRLDKEILNNFGIQLQKDAIELTRTLKPILKIAWFHLDKREYNLINQFNELCKRCISINFPQLNFNDENLLDKVRIFEKQYIACLYKARYPEIIKSCVIYILEKYPTWDVIPSRIAYLIDILLSQDITRPTLYNFILALNMIKYRRFFEFRELLSSSFNHVINNFDFDCGDKIKTEINTHIDKTLNNLLSLLKEREEINKFKRFLPLNDDDSFDFKVVEDFYEEANSAKNLSFAADKENAILFVVNFFETFLRIYGKFLNGPIEIENAEKVEIFSFDYFQFEIDKIKFLLKKLAKYKYSYPNLSIDEVMQFKATQKVGSSPEIEIVQALLELKDISIAIGQKLIEIERKHNPALAHDDSTELKSLNPSTVIGQSLVIPYWNKNIQSPQFLQGQSIFKVILDVISLCLLMGILLYDDEIKLTVIKSNRINSEIQRNKKILERIANVVQYRKLKQRYNLHLI